MFYKKRSHQDFIGRTLKEGLYQKDFIKRTLLEGLNQKYLIKTSLALPIAIAENITD